jgi:hypothetical protein
MSSARSDTSAKAKLVWTKAWPVQTYSFNKLNMNKSSVHVGKNGVLENPHNLPYLEVGEWSGYATNATEYFAIIEQQQTNSHTIGCSNCDRVLVRYKVLKNEVGRENGIVALEHTQHLMAYRRREDGLLGLECVCGLTDTRLSTQEKIKYPNRFPIGAKSTDAEKARFNESKSEFVSKGV